MLSILKRIRKQIRLFKNKKKEPYLSLYRLLGFVPDRIELYEQAFVHRSITSNQFGKNSNNERLEFLGDAILDAIIADVVFSRYPYRREGFLTNTRSKIVKRETMNRIALELGIDKRMSSLPYAMSHHKFMYGNALEALIGAIYLDRGFQFCRNFVETQIVNKYIRLDKLANQEVNFKSRLLEWGQKMRLTVEFELIEEFRDAEGTPVFQTSVTVEGNSLGIGVGGTKKESQQIAARKVLTKINRDRSVKQLIERLTAAAVEPHFSK